MKLAIPLLGAALLLTSPVPELPAGEALRIVCFGDSLTSCGGVGGRYSDMLSKALPNATVINSGKSGDTLADGLARLEEAVLRHRPDCVIVGLGANDYWRRNRSLNELRQDYEAIVGRCRKMGSKVLIISCFGNEKPPHGQTPDFSRPGLSHAEYASGLAQIERELVKRYDCGYVPDMQCAIVPKGRSDLWSDRNHPNAAGNRLVAATILPELRKLLASARPGASGSAGTTAKIRQ